MSVNYKSSTSGTSCTYRMGIKRNVLVFNFINNGGGHMHKTETDRSGQSEVKSAAALC